MATVSSQHCHCYSDKLSLTTPQKNYPRIPLHDPPRGVHASGLKLGLATEFSARAGLRLARSELKWDHQRTGSAERHTIGSVDGLGCSFVFWTSLVKDFAATTSSFSAHVIYV